MPDQPTKLSIAMIAAWATIGVVVGYIFIQTVRGAPGKKSAS